MSKQKRVRRIVITPNETYTGAWRNNDTHLGLIDDSVSLSTHPNSNVQSYSRKYDKNGNVNLKAKTLPIRLFMPDNGHVWIPASIVEQSVVICEFEPEVPKLYQDIAQSFTSIGELVEDWKVERK